MRQATTSIGMALQRCGFRYRQGRTRVRWPRKKGPIGTRVDVKTGKAVAFVS